MSKLLFVLSLFICSVATAQPPRYHYRPRPYIPPVYTAPRYVAPRYVSPFGVPVYPNAYHPMGTYNFQEAPFCYSHPHVYYPNGTTFHWAPNGFYRVR